LNDASAKLAREPAKSAQIVAYLNTIHHDNGTYLINVDEKGVVDVVFRTVNTPRLDLFRMFESIEAKFGWLNILGGFSDAVTNMKIALLEKTFTLARTNEEEEL
jgi:hypothetical protein